MKSFKHCVLKNNKSRYSDRKALIKRVLASDEDYTTEKKVTLKGEEITPWSMYISEKVGGFEDYPEYAYLEFSLYIYDSIIDPIEHEFERTPGYNEGQGSLVCCSSQGHRIRHSLVTE